MNNKAKIDNLPPLELRVQKLAQYLIALRKMQDKTDAVLLQSLGNVSIQELNVLNIIGDNEPCIMSEIARQAALSLSSVTVIVEKLVKKKLVKRVRSDEDRRIVRGSLTEEGKKIHLAQIEHMHAVLRKILNALTVDEQENFLHIFHKITISLT
jgi:DNA-binding MarR family transcriptional regulator